MYRVRIWINTDGDFGYDDPEFEINKDLLDTEKIFYFENRKGATDAIIRSFHNLKNTLRSYDCDYVKKWIDSMDNRIALICQKFKSFTIDKEFGNQDIVYELLETKKIKMSNGSYTYISMTPDIDFSWYEEEIILWDEVINMPDINEE